MPAETPAPATDPRLAVALARAERRLELLQELAGMGMSLAREINQRFIEGPHRPEPRPDPAHAFAAVSRAVRLTLILEARTEKQILAWRKGDLSALGALQPEPFLAPRFDSPVARRERVRDSVVAAIDRETLDRHEADAMRDRVQRELIETDDLDDHRLKGGFRACVEAICGDLGIEPDWSRWSDDEGFPPAPAVGNGAVSGACIRGVARDPGRPTHPPPGSPAERAGPPSPLRGREGNLEVREREPEIVRKEDAPPRLR